MTEYPAHNQPPSPAFPGFPALRSKVTFVPLQFFTLVLSHCSRGHVRNAGYVLRKLVGWVDARGESTQGQGERGFPIRTLADDLGRESWAVDLSEMTRTVVVLCFELWHDTRSKPIAVRISRSPNRYPLCGRGWAQC